MVRQPTVGYLEHVDEEDLHAEGFHHLIRSRERAKKGSLLLKKKHEKKSRKKRARQ